MAYRTGVADDHVALWNELISFLTTDPDLGGGQWEIVWQHADYPNTPELVIKGPGGTSGVCVGLRREDTVRGQYIAFRGMSDYVDTATDWSEHTNVSPFISTILVDEMPLKYWMVASGRRFAMIVNVSTVYEVVYAGLFLPYADPIAYDYPIFVGGCSSMGVGGEGPINWRSTDPQHAMFHRASHYDPDLANVPANASMMTQDGAWVQVAQASEISEVSGAMLGPSMFGSGATPWDAHRDWNVDDKVYGYENLRSRTTEQFGGGYGLRALTLVRQSPTDVSYGVLEGMYAPDCVGQLTENVITADAENYLVAQNVFRAADTDYIAMRLV